MPGESCPIHRASAVITLAVSVIVTLALVLAATAETSTKDADPAHAGPARKALSR